MARRLIAYSGILVLVLATVSIMVSRGVLQSAITDADVTLELLEEGQADVDDDGELDGVLLGGEAKLRGEISIGAGGEQIESVEISVAPVEDNTVGNPPDFTVRAQPVVSTSTTIKTFTAASARAAGDLDDGVVRGSIPGSTRVTVAIDVFKVSTSSLPGTFKGSDAASAITYDIGWVNEACQTPGQVPCGPGGSIAGSYEVTLSVKQPGSAGVSATAQVDVVDVDAALVGIEQAKQQQHERALA